MAQFRLSIPKPLPQEGDQLPDRNEPRLAGKPNKGTSFTSGYWREIAEAHPRVSDGGAHTRYQTLGQWPVAFLASRVRGDGMMALEKAHYNISALPAYIAGFTDRGILKEGLAADIIVYDQDRLGLQYDQPVYDTDVPGGERRIIQKAKGIRYTTVNGDLTISEGTICTGASPGKLLRSYNMVSR